MRTFTIGFRVKPGSTIVEAFSEPESYPPALETLNELARTVKLLGDEPLVVTCDIEGAPIHASGSLTPIDPELDAAVMASLHVWARSGAKVLEEALKRADKRIIEFFKAFRRGCVLNADLARNFPLSPEEILADLSIGTDSLFRETRLARMRKRAEAEISASLSIPQ